MRVVLDEKPEKLSIASDEWVIAGGQIDTETGELAGSEFGMFISVKRKE